MEAFSVYKDMQSRTNGEIYIGVVGPVRTGKSTFIKKFMDTTVIPNIEDEAARDRAVDELPPYVDALQQALNEKRGSEVHDDRAEVYPRTGRYRKNG